MIVERFRIRVRVQSESTNTVTVQLLSYRFQGNHILRAIQSFYICFRFVSAVIGCHFERHCFALLSGEIIQSNQIQLLKKKKHIDL